MADIEIRRSTLSKAREMDAFAATSRNAVNAKIGAVRARYITSLPGQEMIYSSKEREAKTYLALDPRPTDLTDFPFLEAEIGITAATAPDLAALWVQMAAEWRSIGPQLEQLRLGSLASIAAATSPAEVTQTLADLDAILEGL